MLKERLSDETRKILNIIIEEKIKRSLGHIYDGIERIDTLINGILKISRTGRVDMECSEVSMNKLLEEIRENFKIELEKKGCEFIISDLPDCYGDKNLLSQLFTNIISNALKYKDEKRKLVIKVEGTVKYKKVIYSVSDTGVGIEEKYLKKVWDLFYRINPEAQVKGEGIGLNIVKSIADKHGANIYLESKIDEGTTFKIEIPRQKFKLIL